MSDLNRYIEIAAGMPVLDAAYILWIYKHRLDREERGARPYSRQDSLEDLKAPFASTFTRLKCAHPEANDEALHAAIRAAAKLNVDCHRASVAVNRMQKDGDENDLVSTAIDMARQQNPGFSDKTYESAWYKLRLSRMW